MVLKCTMVLNKYNTVQQELYSKKNEICSFKIIIIIIIPKKKWLYLYNIFCILDSEDNNKCRDNPIIHPTYKNPLCPSLYSLGLQLKLDIKD